MDEITFKVDYLSITIWGSHEEGLEIFDHFLADHVGDPIHVGHGHRGYEWWARALSGVNLYSIPAKGDQKHGHIELKGSACEVIPMDTFRKLVLYLKERHEKTGQRYKVTRLDLAWDGINATPTDFLEAKKNDHIRTHAQRDKWALNESPIKEEEDIRITRTVYLGSSSSERRVRVYDKRGYTRLELQTRNDRAHKVTESLFVHLTEKWREMGIGHLRDYMDVFKNEEKDELAPLWEELVGAVIRAIMKVIDAKQVELYRLQKWIIRQVAPALSVIADTVGEGVIDTYLEYGRATRGDRYKPILEICITEWGF